MQCSFKELCKITEVTETIVLVYLSRAINKIKKEFLKIDGTDYDQIKALLDNHFDRKNKKKLQIFLKIFYLENKDLRSSLDKYKPLFLYFNQAKKKRFQKKQEKDIKHIFCFCSKSAIFTIFDKNDNLKESAR